MGAPYGARATLIQAWALYKDMHADGAYSSDKFREELEPFLSRARGGNLSDRSIFHVQLNLLLCV